MRPASGFVPLTAAVALAPTASANTGGGCRSWNTGSWAQEPFNVQLDSCSWFNASDSPFTKVNPCAQLVNVNTGQWAYDFGCIGESYYLDKSNNTGHDVYAGMDFGRGTYVVQVGFWYNGSYYGGVQSPRITIG